MQVLHGHTCAVLTSCYLPGHKRCGHCQLDRSSFLFNFFWREWVVGQVISPGVSSGLLVTSTREVKGQVKSQGSVA